MPSPFAKHLQFAMIAIPIGAASGYVCALIVDFAASFFEHLYYSPTPYKFGLIFRYVTTCWAPVGAALGAVMLPVTYLVVFRHITIRQAPSIVGWLYCGVLGAGLLASPLSEVPAFLGVFLGFLAGMVYGYRKTKVQIKK